MMDKASAGHQNESKVITFTILQHYQQSKQYQQDAVIKDIINLKEI